MVFNCFDWEKDEVTPKVHPNQKPIKLLRRLIRIFTSPGDVVIDPCAGSAVALLAAAQLGRKPYGFEIKKNFCKDAEDKILKNVRVAKTSEPGTQLSIIDHGKA